MVKYTKALPNYLWWVSGELCLQYHTMTSQRHLIAFSKILTMDIEYSILIGWECIQTI